MYFYVFLEPNVFEEALADGQDAMQNIGEPALEIRSLGPEHQREIEGLA